MIRLMVVEDEAPILRGICNMIQRSESGCAVAATAFNGQEAMDYLAAHAESIDAVITDICMPQVNGIDLLRWIRSSGLPIEVMLLSGYQDFQYAQQAVQYGAFEYITKPVSKERLRESLIRMRERICDHQLTEYLPASRCIAKQSLAKLRQGLGSEDSCRLSLFVLGSYASDPFQPCVDQSAIAAFERALQGKLEQAGIDFLLFQEKNTLTLVYRARHWYLLEAIARRAVDDSGDVPLSCFHAPETFPLSMVSQQKKALEAAQKRLMRYAQATVMQVQETLPAQSEYLLSESYQFQLHRLSQAQDREGLHTLLKQLFREMQDCCATQFSVERTLKMIVFSIFQSQQLLDLSLIDMEADAMQFVAACCTYDGLFQAFERSLCDAFFSRMKRTANDVITQRVATYLESNLADCISMQTLAAMFGISSSYLAKLFRDCYGCTPIEFLVDLRIERAKALLATPEEIKTKDVASCVGYEDAFYFSRLFKKKTGMAPSQYRASVVR